MSIVHIILKTYWTIVSMYDVSNEGPFQYVYSLAGSTHISQNCPVNRILMLEVLHGRREELSPTASVRAPLHLNS